MSKVFFSVIIPTYNRANFIGKTIESILSQTYQNFELIIVDDGSIDNTKEIVGKYLNNKVSYHKKTNAERAAARNFGTKLAKGDYVNWFDSDDIMLPNHLEEAKNLIESKENPEVIALPYQIVDSQKSVVLQTFDFAKPTLNNLLHKGNFLACNPVIVRKDIAVKYLFNENRDLSGSEDYDLWMRLAARFPIYSGSKITSHLIQHDERSMSSLNMEKIDKRIELAWQSLWNDEGIVKKYSKDKPYMLGFKESFLAVHYAQAKDYAKAKEKLALAFRAYPLIITNKAFLATIKKLIIG